MTSYLTRRPLFADLEDLHKVFEYATNQSQVIRSNELNRRLDFKSNPATLEIEVPGIPPSDVKVKIEGRSLMVETPKGNTFVTLDQKLDTDRATATLKHGLLTINIPKKETRTLEIAVSED